MQLYKSIYFLVKFYYSVMNEKHIYSCKVLQIIMIRHDFKLGWSNYPSRFFQTRTV